MCSPPHKTYTYFNYKVSVYENTFNFQNVIIFFLSMPDFKLMTRKKNEN